jgi:thiosulfate dehydrogenase
MNRSAALSVTAMLAALAGGCNSGPPAPIVERGTAIDHGEALFNDPTVAGTDLNTYSCATCHAVDASDSGPVRTGGSLAGVTKRPSYWAGQELDLLPSVNACLYFFMFKDEPWTAEDVEARALYAYLESISKDADAKPAPFTVVADIADLPRGDAAKGAPVYDRACSLCHGPAHSGKDRLVDYAPVLPEDTLRDHPLGKYTEDERRLVFVEKVRHGAFISYSGQMPPFSLEKLPDEDLADLLTYLDLYK